MKNWIYEVIDEDMPEGHKVIQQFISANKRRLVIRETCVEDSPIDKSKICIKHNRELCADGSCLDCWWNNNV